jgi:hypothetical protein
MRVNRIGYQGGTLVTQLWFTHNQVITGFEWMVHRWLLGYIILIAQDLITGLNQILKIF